MIQLIWPGLGQCEPFYFNMIKVGSNEKKILNYANIDLPSWVFISKYVIGTESKAAAVDKPGVCSNGVAQSQRLSPSRKQNLV